MFVSSEELTTIILASKTLTFFSKPTPSEFYRIIGCWLQNYLPNSNTINVPGKTFGLGRGFSLVAAGVSPYWADIVKT